MIDLSRIEIVDDRQAEIYRKMTPLQRIERGLSMAAFARAIYAADIRRAHPDWDEARVATASARRFAGDTRT